MFSPSEDWKNERPRTLTFIRAGLRVKALRRLIRDIIGVEVEGVKVYNVYIYLEEKNEGQTA
jgi:hypothetical protein